MSASQSCDWGPTPSSSILETARGEAYGSRANNAWRELEAARGESSSPASSAAAEASLLVDSICTKALASTSPSEPSVECWCTHSTKSASASSRSPKDLWRSSTPREPERSASKRRKAACVASGSSAALGSRTAARKLEYVTRLSQTSAKARISLSASSCASAAPSCRHAFSSASCTSRTFSVPWFARSSDRKTSRICGAVPPGSSCATTCKTARSIGGAFTYTCSERTMRPERGSTAHRVAPLLMSHGWRIISCALGRLAGSLTSRLLTKSVASWDREFHFPTARCIRSTLPALIIRLRSRSFPRNGGCPIRSRYVMTPTLHMSHLWV
mmetsp:Transcript_31476/g.84505  ORF Transcript_31476/g.84505 Transcript_31476/m.84505 type:complete len:329 (+) Transcript_31476:446-1432(+)